MLSMEATTQKAQKVGRNDKNLQSELLIDKAMEKSAPLKKLIIRKRKTSFIFRAC